MKTRLVFSRSNGFNRYTKNVMVLDFLSYISRLSNPSQPLLSGSYLDGVIDEITCYNTPRNKFTQCGKSCLPFRCRSKKKYNATRLGHFFSKAILLFRFFNVFEMRIGCLVFFALWHAKADTVDFPLSDDMFEGDIKSSQEQIAQYYGSELAKELVDEGIIEANAGGDRRELGVGKYIRFWNHEPQVNGRYQIPYVVMSDLQSFKSTIEGFLVELENEVRYIEFIPRTNQQSFLKFEKESGCWSWVGRTYSSSGQTVSLGSGCVSRRIVKHEVMHALGFFHEQSRPDRGDFVDIIEDNIRSGYVHNFDTAQVNSLGSSYDIKSVMHYSGGSWGKSRAVCSDTNVCDRAISIRKGDTDLCLDAGNNEMGSHVPVGLKTCDPESDHQTFIMMKRNEREIDFKLGSDPSLCLDDELTSRRSRLSNGIDIAVRDCNQVTDGWQVHGSSLSGMKIRFGGDPSRFCLQRSGSSVELSGCGDTWDLVSNSSQICDNVPICNGFSGSFNTISSKVPGKSPGGSSDVQPSDILQLQLIYKCSTPRTFDSLCSDDCVCQENEGKCSEDTHCEGMLTCNIDGFCVNDPDRTRAPSTGPSPTATPTFGEYNCEREDNVVKGKRLRVMTEPSWEDCKDKCQSEAQCKAWDYALIKSRKNCKLLKNAKKFRAKRNKRKNRGPRFIAGPKACD